MTIPCLLCIYMYEMQFFIPYRLHIPSEVTVTENDATAFMYRDALGQDIPIEGWKYTYVLLSLTTMPCQQGLGR